MGKEKKPKKNVRNTDIVENIGKVLINLGQLMFGTLFLGSVIRGGNINHNRSFRFGKRAKNKGGIEYVDNMGNVDCLNTFIWGNAVGLVA
jgi:hypothetical protein